jgi:hypothetical protein
VGTPSPSEKETFINEPPRGIPISIKFHGSGIAFTKAADIWIPIEIYFENDLFDEAPWISVEYRRPDHTTEYGIQHVGNPFEFEIWKCGIMSMISLRENLQSVRICIELRGRIRAA